METDDVMSVVLLIITFPVCVAFTHVKIVQIFAS